MPSDDESDDTDGEAFEPEQYVKYRRVSDQYNPPSEHRQIDTEEDVWLSPTEKNIDHLESLDWIEVSDWEFEYDHHVNLTGPPELVIGEEGGLNITRPRSDGRDVRNFELGQFQCQRCDHIQGNQLSVGDKVIEPHQCISCERNGPWMPLGLEDSPMSLGTLVNPIWKPPTGVSDREYDGLFSQVQEFIGTYWYTPDDWLYPGLAAYAISTWLRPNFDYLPHLMVLGKHETGKTRLLNTLSEVSYRGIVPVNASPASVFRTVDNYNTTFYLSEYHDLLDDTRQEIDSLIKGAQKRNEVVLRTESNGDSYSMRAFQVFTHVGIGTQYDLPDDTASRCIRVRTKPADDQMPDLRDATELRNELLYARWRLHESDEWDESWDEAEDFLKKRGVKHRLREKLLPLATVGVIWDQLDELHTFVMQMVREREEERADSEDAMVIRSMMELSFQQLAKGGQSDLDGDPWEGVSLKYSAICRKYEELTGEELTSQKFGHIRKRLDLGKEHYEKGTYVEQEDLGLAMKKLADENGLAWESLSGNEANDPTETEAQKEALEELATFVRENQGEDGVEYDRLIRQFSHWGVDTVQNRIEKLLNRGVFYQPEKGKIFYAEA